MREPQISPVSDFTVLDGMRQKVFLDRYSAKDKDGNPTEKYPEQMWQRVAYAIASVEKFEKKEVWAKEFYRIMADFKFVPGGRILSGAGTEAQVTYFNCFVIPSPQDSRGGIIQALGRLIEIQSRSGGVGLNLSSLRPKGARVKKVNGTSSGPVNWAELFSVATHDIVQQGGSRRGATMLMMWDWHPDIEEFITVKQDLSRINGANLSVCISDSFMEAVKNDGDWQLVYPDLDEPEYDELWDGDIEKWKSLGKKVKVYKTLKAREIWNLICEAAWRSAEPGLHFLERSNKRSNTWYFEKLIATNPCGEQCLGAWAVCNLGAMNLSAYVKGDEFDYDTFGRDVHVAMRFLDDVIDQTYYFFPENKKCALDIRRTGLGIMGLADALIKMKVAYGSPESLPIIHRIFETLRDNSYEASSDIAAEKGSFPMFDTEKYLQGYHITKLSPRLRDKIKTQGIRNAVLLTVAPTGTTSLLAGVSSGIEPVYEFSYKLKWRDESNKGWREDFVYHPLYGQWTEKHPGEGKPSYFVSANDLTPEGHATVQAVAQEYIDASISKTVNAPNSHTVKEVKELYAMAYDLGLKGITYMRDGSRPGVLSREEKKETVEVATVGVVLPRPDVMMGATYRMMTPMGSAFITVNDDKEGNPVEVFVNIGKAGSDLAAMAAGLGRTISTLLRLNSSISPTRRAEEIVEQLTGIGGRRSVGFGPNKVSSLPDAVAQALKRHMMENKIKKMVNESEVSVKFVNGESHHQAGAVMAALNPTLTTLESTPLASSSGAVHGADICPACGAVALVHEEGCVKCYACGHTEC